jgi:amino acid transporter
VVPSPPLQTLAGKAGSAAVERRRCRRAQLTLWPLVIATFFMVSGGTYGTEDIVRGGGYGTAILVLLLTPVVWSLPTALMIGELAAAMPHEGGYYAWVRRALGNCWGFQEAWLSLAASVFDMAIYPTLFVAYLTRLFPWFAVGNRGVMAGLAVVLACAAMNLAGIRVVAQSSVWLFVLLSAPFVAIVAVAPFRHSALAQVSSTPVAAEIGVAGGILVAMWNYMGWDCASTIAAEVEQPQRTYPRAMVAAVGVVALSYVLPVAAMWWTGATPGAFVTGSWADLAGMLAGRWLQVALVAGGMMSAFGMFNALVLSYSRLPLAMARDGMLPRMFAREHGRSNAPWVSIVVLAAGWAACLGIGFERLVTLDILLYGASLALEFVALVALRISAPEMPRPFRVPGGRPGVVALGICPVLLLGFAAAHSHNERVLGMNALLFGAMIIVAGFVVYAFTAGKQRTSNFDF